MQCCICAFCILSRRHNTFNCQTSKSEIFEFVILEIRMESKFYFYQFYFLELLY